VLGFIPQRAIGTYSTLFDLLDLPRASISLLAAWQIARQLISQIASSSVSFLDSRRLSSFSCLAICQSTADSDLNSVVPRSTVLKSASDIKMIHQYPDAMPSSSSYLRA
jgi:hypothetical protein